MKKCPNCGIPNHDDMKICFECGYLFKEKDVNLNFFKAS